MIINRFTYVLGLLLLLVGVLDVFPGYDLLHAIVGLCALYSSSDYMRAKRFNQFSSIFFAGLAVLALVPDGALQTLFGIAPLSENAVWFHAVTAVTVAYLGFAWEEKKMFSPAPKPTHS